MKVVKDGPKRLRRTRRDLPYGQISLWGCKRSEFALTRPDRLPLADEGSDAVDSVWTDRIVADRHAEVEACWQEKATIDQSLRDRYLDEFFDWLYGSPLCRCCCCTGECS